MKGLIKRAAALLTLAAAVGAFAGCQCYREIVDPCYPERYNALARQETLTPFAGQVGNGHVLNQTIWNYMFEYGSDKLTPGGLSQLGYLSRVRPAADCKLYLQTAHDITYDPAAPQKYELARAELDQNRRVAILKFLSAETAGRPLPFTVDVHDAPVPYLAAPAAATSVQKWYPNFQGVLSGGAATVGTAGSGTPSR
jgi:hypothetical protein